MGSGRWTPPSNQVHVNCRLEKRASWAMLGCCAGDGVAPGELRLREGDQALGRAFQEGREISQGCLRTGARIWRLGWRVAL